MRLRVFAHIFKLLSSDTHIGDAMSEEQAMRRKPKQARSQQRVDHLLDTAAAVFVEAGYEGATTNAIAARAGVSIGSLYQFFPNKEAILDALAERYIAETHALLDEALALDQPLTVAISRMVDGLAMYSLSSLGFRAVFMISGTAAGQAQAVGRMHTQVIERVDALMSERFPGIDPARTRVGSTVGVAIVKGLMVLSGAGDLPLEALLAEIKVALLAYLRAFLLAEGRPLPDDLV